MGDGIELSEEALEKRVGVYGGTFDPMHNGHWQVAEAVLRAFAMDRLLFVPAYVPPHKRGHLISSPYHRLAMLILATAQSPRMFVSSVELEAPSRPYTVETLQRLQSENPEVRLFFVMGEDSFKDVMTWHEYERILSEYDVIVATRPGYGQDQSVVSRLTPELRARVVDLRGGRFPSDETLAWPRIYLTDYIEVDVSATSVREAAARGAAIEGLVPPAVAAYLVKYGLYRKSECQKS